jgi:hypothetical protein
MEKYLSTNMWKIAVLNRAQSFENPMVYAIFTNLFFITETEEIYERSSY